MAQPVGLVVEPVVLNRLGIFPESATTVLADWQQRLEQLLEDQPAGEQWLSAAPSFELFCQEVLAWEPGDLRKPEELATPVAVTLDDYDEVLRPDWVVGEPSQGEGPLKAQLLVQELAVGTPFDALPKGTDGRRCWRPRRSSGWSGCSRKASTRLACFGTGWPCGWWLRRGANPAATSPSRWSR